MRAKQKMGFEGRQDRKPKPSSLSPRMLEVMRQHEARYRYRFMILQRAAGPWRRTKKEAIADGIRAGEAVKDEHSGAVYLGVFSWLWEVEVEADQAAA